LILISPCGRFRTKAAPQRRQLPLYAAHALPDVGGRILASLVFETPVYLPETFDPPLDLRGQAHEVGVELALDPECSHCQPGREQACGRAMLVIRKAQAGRPITFVNEVNEIASSRY
jgi:hypothetical protein